MATLRRLLKVIAEGDDAAALKLLRESPDLVRASVGQGEPRATASEHFLTAIRRQVYAGDTALHIAAAAYRSSLARKLIRMGADVSARNRRGAAPLHYAAVGSPGTELWNPRAQAATIACLIAAGADPDATDKSGATPLHRAVRTRSAPAVRALLQAGADLNRTNGNGSTPLALTRHQTGRSGSGAPEAQAQRAEIVQLLERHGATL